MILEQLGYNQNFSAAFDALGLADSAPGRVVWQSAFSYRVQCENAEIAAEPTGKLKAADLPAVGDWVTVISAESEQLSDKAVITPVKSGMI